MVRKSSVGWTNPNPCEIIVLCGWHCGDAVVQFKGIRKKKAYNYIQNINYDIEILYSRSVGEKKSLEEALFTWRVPFFPAQSMFLLSWQLTNYDFCYFRPECNIVTMEIHKELPFALLSND